MRKNFILILVAWIAINTGDSACAQPNWIPPHNMQFNMQVVGKIKLENGGFANNSEDIIGAFVGNECRGVAYPLDASGMIFLTICSNIYAGEVLNFKAYISQLNVIVILNESFNFVDLGEVGTFSDPYIFTYDSMAVYHIISSSAGSNGTIDPVGDVNVLEGSSQTFAIEPNTGYIVSDVLVDGASLGAVTDYTFNNVVANHSIAASFAINTYTITASAGGNGTINPSGNVTVSHGGNQLFTFYPNAGYMVYAMWVDGDSIGNNESYTFESVTANHSIYIHFAEVVGVDESKIVPSHVLIWPNPVAEHLFIQSNLNILNPKELRYLIFDLNNQMIREGNLERMTQLLELNDLSAGLYLLNVYDGAQLIETCKFIKM